MTPPDDEPSAGAHAGRGVAVGRTPGALGYPEGTPALQPDTTAKPLGRGSALAAGPEIFEPGPVRAHKSFGIALHRCSHPVFAKHGARRFEVRQGSVRNCPLPALLAAMAFTGTLGRIGIAEKRQPAVSTYKGTSITVDRHFQVTFPGRDPIAVTDRFWGAGECRMEYARSTDDALWVSLIEKAYVKLRAGNTYENLSNVSKAPDANTVVEDLTGVKIANVVVVAAETEASLKAHLQKAAKTPMIARLDNPSSNNAHAYTVEGLDAHVADEVLLFDALSGDGFSMSLKRFQKQYSHLLFP